jgi:hypothetical protein
MSGLLNTTGAVSGILGTTTQAMSSSGSTSATDLDSGTLATARMAGGTLVNAEYFLNTAGNWSTTSTTEKAVTAFNSITVTSGNTIVIGAVGYFTAEESSGGGSQRWGYIRFRYHTSSVAEDVDVSAIGTKVWTTAAGREMVGAGSTEAAGSYVPVHAQGAWVASGTSFYFGMSVASSTANINCNFKMTANDPFYTYYYEFKGDILS